VSTPLNLPVKLGALYTHLSESLAAAKIEEPRLEARMLLAHAAGIDQTRIIGYPEENVDAETAKRARDMIARRKTGEPIAYIIGSREFWSLTFKVSKATLIPRPDSETLIEAVLAAAREKSGDKSASLRILDLGTGSGCLLLALLSELPNATGTGIDLNAAACLVALENAKNLGRGSRANFREGDWLAGMHGTFDIIISNPPYIVEAEIASLEVDVKLFEPHLALSGGPDGLAAYRTIAAQTRPHLAAGGLLGVEIGIGQAADIKGIFTDNGFKILGIYQDIANIERCILATVEDS